MSDPNTLNQASLDIWNQNAAFWDEYMGEGGSFQTRLIGPATERLLVLQPGERVLDVACGNGAFSRRLAQLGAQVLACDFSEVFLARARARTTEHADRIEYRRADATDQAQLLALGPGERRFDAAVCTMALMDMSAIEPVFSALARLLKSTGRFVFSTMHPCFNSNNPKKIVEEEDREGEMVTTYAMKVTHYIRPMTFKGLGIIGQPVPQYYFHRPLGLLFNAAFQAGFVLDGLEEPVFDSAQGARRTFSWENLRDVPPVLVERLRLK